MTAPPVRLIDRELRRMDDLETMLRNEILELEVHGPVRDQLARRRRKRAAAQAARRTLALTLVFVAFLPFYLDLHMALRVALPFALLDTALVGVCLWLVGKLPGVPKEWNR